MLDSLILALVVSFFVNLLIIRLSHKYQGLLTDRLHEGPQKFHQFPVPRLGGIGLICGLLSCVLFVNLKKDVFFLKNIPFYFLR